jgi:hypothetical protein
VIISEDEFAGDENAKVNKEPSKKWIEIYFIQELCKIQSFYIKHVYTQKAMAKSFPLCSLNRHLFDIK